MNTVERHRRLSGVSILCIEDEHLISSMYKKGLELAGANVVVAIDGVEGLEVLKSQEFSIILLDLEMPNLNGFETLVKLKSDTVYKEIPTIILSNASALAEVSSVSWLRSMGVDEVLLKCNVSISNLVNHISGLLGDTDAGRV